MTTVPLVKGFDEIFKQDFEPDWIVMPRFYVLDGKTWECPPFSYSLSTKLLEARKSLAIV